jgi:hypothetical protein
VIFTFDIFQFFIKIEKTIHSNQMKKDFFQPFDRNYGFFIIIGI